MTQSILKPHTNCILDIVKYDNNLIILFQIKLKRIDLRMYSMYIQQNY